ncbi:LytTR family transcriptional regulator DNA-binding domain-containing protein [Spirosoma jeollabukense]
MIILSKESSQLLIPAYRHLQDTQLITRLEGRGNYTAVYLKDKTYPLIVSRTLKFFEDQLTDFIRINKSTMINPKHVNRVIREDAKTVSLLLSDGVLKLTSRRRIADTLARLAN